MKPGFRVVDMPKLNHKDRVVCKRCNTEYHADELLYACPLKGPNNTHLSWYCPTHNCLGRLNYGVYYLQVSC
jgi:hypothetical protein